MIELPLSRGRVALIDEDDFTNFGGYKWSLTGDRYVTRRALVDGRPRTIYLHRAILDAPKGIFVDHVNGDGLDNRRANLRLCQMSQNIGNSHKWRRPTSSRYKGVCWSKQAGRWQANITINRRMLHLGHFRNEIDAAVAYDRAAIEAFGPFARINFPIDGFAAAS